MLVSMFVYLCIYVWMYLCVCVFVEFIIRVNVGLWKYEFVVLWKRGFVALLKCGFVVLCEFYSQQKTKNTDIIFVFFVSFIDFYYNQIVMSVVSLFHSSLTAMVIRWWWL